MTETMKAAVWTEPERIEYKEVERPTPGPGEALVRVGYGGICGSDLMIYLGKHPRAKPPLILCHEFSGTIVASDGDVYEKGTPVAINPLLFCGDCYACNTGIPHICESLGLVGIDQDGGFSEYVAVPLHTIHVLPESISLAQGALVEPLAVAVHAVRASDLKVGDVTAVLGAGPVGILTAQVARLAGARKVFVSELSPKRKEVARDLGFEVIDVAEEDPVEVILDATDGVGVPVAFDAAGVQATVDQTGKIVRVGGQILQVGMPKTPPRVDMTMLLFREITRKPIRVYTDEDVSKAVAIAATGEVDLEAPVTHTLPLEDLGEAMEIAHEGTEACKILMAPGV
jgi:2-desacetyl-2-hydroxyethyl bacteriochlorophyllide A dehydrogenase